MYSFFSYYRKGKISILSWKTFLKYPIYFKSILLIITSSSETLNNKSISFSTILYALAGFQSKFSISDLFSSIFVFVNSSKIDNELSSLSNSITPTRKFFFNFELKSILIK